MIVPFFSMEKVYPNARDLAMIVTANYNMLPQAMDQARPFCDSAAHWPQQTRELCAVHCRTNGGTIPPNHRMTFLVMIVLSSIGLLVGGIGVMNIMLVSVTGGRAKSASAKPSGLAVSISSSSFWSKLRVEQSRRTCWALLGVADRHGE